MSILSRVLGRKTPQAGDLVGCWQLESTEGQPYQPAEIDFRADGTVYYSALYEGRWQVLEFTYRVEGDVVVTARSSAPKEERSRFAVTPDGALTLEFDGVRSVFRRGEKRAPGA